MGWEDDASKHWEDTAWDSFKWAWDHVKDYAKYSFWEFNFRWRELAWEGVRAWTKRFCKAIFAKVKDAYDDAVEYAWGYIEGLLNSIVLVWGSITSLWAQFGANLLDTGLTVWDWVTSKVSHIYWWVVTTYDEARIWVATQANWVVQKANESAEWLEAWADSIVDWIENKAGIVWDWIVQKADNVWTWIETTAQSLEDWYNRNAQYYSDIYDDYREVLSSFLEDPEKFILDWVADGAEYVISWAVTWWW